jgi:hypothetical protein
LYLFLSFPLSFLIFFLGWSESNLDAANITKHWPIIFEITLLLLLFLLFSNNFQLDLLLHWLFYRDTDTRRQEKGCVIILRRKNKSTCKEILALFIRKAARDRITAFTKNERDSLVDR